jgi:hypothetical protein
MENAQAILKALNSIKSSLDSISAQSDKIQSLTSDQFDKDSPKLWSEEDAEARNSHMAKIWDECAKISSHCAVIKANVAILEKQMPVEAISESAEAIEQKAEDGELF